MIAIRKILFACDLSDAAAKMVPYVLSVTEKYQSALVLLHVVEDVNNWAALHLSPASLATFQAEAESGAQAAMDAFRAQHLPNFQALEIRMIVGSPAVEILKAAAEAQIDLVIMGTHGRKGLEHMLLGSVAETVLKNTRLPVLVINPYKVP